MVVIELRARKAAEREEDDDGGMRDVTEERESVNKLFKVRGAALSLSFSFAQQRATL